MTSLRISDILALCWEDIVDYSAGGKCVHIITQKNKTEDIIPISEEALGLIGYSSEKKGLVFKGLMRSWTQAPMKEWIRSAGITKNITFHSYRRTFANPSGGCRYRRPYHTKHNGTQKHYHDYALHESRGQ